MQNLIKLYHAVKEYEHIHLETVAQPNNVIIRVNDVLLYMLVMNSVKPS